ncbi:MULTISPECIES: hypothetical protein [Rhodopseudomonas]|uniref:hypothetical protein n=1 Tax=Rhodopseudomonas TaxID=1073 RepID=UPI00128B1CE5|nr:MULTISPECIES: hypothetical protein [Rhodopseudomonas]MDF3814213.1 hypothetical protein [Rhodopseudomonas sp. BAL398]WOK18675.1 hypothetical protein RBJ75_03880 [Rhodopseudomonas sp. BAL398]
MVAVIAVAVIALPRAQQPMVSTAPPPVVTWRFDRPPGSPIDGAWMHEFLKLDKSAGSDKTIASITAPHAWRRAGRPAAPPPDPPVPAAAQAGDAACRAKERSLGIINAGPCVDIGALVDNLAEGEYRFTKPKAAYLGQPFRLTLVLKTAANQDVAERFEPAQGEVVVREGKYAQSLEATLRADDVSIEPSGPQLRTATWAAPVEWSWTLTPQSEGEKRLVIEVAANLHVGADKHLVQVTTLREAVLIQVGLLQRIKLYVAQFNGFVVALTGLLGALGALWALVPPIRRGLSGLLRRRDRPRRAR